MRILQYPEDQKLLRTPGALVTPDMVASQDFQNQLEEMKKTLMTDGDGIGLAAPQVGWSVNLFILLRDEDLNPCECRVFLNAKVLQVAKTQIKETEGCLSLKGLSLDIKRPDSIKWEYETMDFQKVVSESKGYYARAILHETEHCAGRLFIDGLSSTQQLKVQKWLKERRG